MLAVWKNVWVKLISGGRSCLIRKVWMMSKNKQSQKITISVDGNISSGKSTLVSNLKELFPHDFGLQVELIPEPLEKWTNLNGHNLLGMFYDDPVKNNFMFQHYVQLTRLVETVKERNEGKQGEIPGESKDNRRLVRIMERSLQNNRYCFTELAVREGRLEPAEFAVLSQWHKWLEGNFDLHLDLIIYLRTSPETVYKRMQQRGRAEESTVPMDYLKKLHEAYEDWLIRGKVDKVSMNVQKEGSNLNGNGDPCHQQKIIVVDGNQSKEQVADECSSFIRAYMKEKGHESTSGLSKKRIHDEVMP